MMAATADRALQTGVRRRNNSWAIKRKSSLLDSKRHGSRYFDEWRMARATAAPAEIFFGK